MPVMRESAACPASGLVELRAHYELFAHAPSCHQRRLAHLRQRERAADQQAWRHRKKLDRAMKIMAKGGRRPLAPLARTQLAAKVNAQLGVLAVQSVTSLEPNR
jgi:hypothetical protein